jgi:hypothetical protein
MICGYWLFTDRGGCLATLCNKCAYKEAVTQRAQLNWWRKHRHEYDGRQRKYVLMERLESGKARFDDDTSDGPGTYVPISTYQHETETIMVCENGHPIPLAPYCVKLNPEQHGIPSCECEDCLGELHDDWSREPGGNPIVVRKTFAYINYHLSVRILSTAMDHEHIYTRRSTLDMAGDWGQQKPTAEALAFINRLWWHADRNVMGPYWELDWVDGERPYTLRGTHFVDEWKQADDASYEDVVTEFGEVRLVTA